ncbi:uncharacterized protein LOC127799899 [Diospyros lotus]|uniref:uncharacterized protein LOC127799899 n=1 Tax=Diospyros lotus TaxID=55363 RepID=UPI0022557424|nr:uncharacterized protein LOC127799899 [Diospyros lotus]XP_052190124.1 uncharacterized protein LOC127799899 [Diospyros lotus]XP_052190125.1 uncharacterized protein LOC127799899 [Diospyros lotus]
MERATPVRKPHTSTADLLTWSENPPAAASSTASGPRSAPRSHQPSDGISKVVFGGQVTDEEVESLNKRKPCSANKLKEITGSGIFEAESENGTLESDANASPNSKTGLRMYQQAVAGISHISFGEEEAVSPKKPATLPEVAKQRELSGTLESESEAKLKKPISDAKCKELSGHDIFAPPPEIQPRPLATRALALRESIEIGEPAARNPAGGQSNDIVSEETVVKTAKKINSQKFAELTGNNIFRGDAESASAERSLSSAKLREMSGNDIFADGKVESRDYFGGVRKPPGGGSSIALV